MLKIDENEIEEVKQFRVGSERFGERKDAIKRLYELGFRKWMNEHPYIKFKDISVEIFELIDLERETIQRYYETQSTTSDREILEKAVEVLNKSDKEYAVRVLHHLNTALNHDSI